jgi:hypothetical protein
MYMRTERLGLLLGLAMVGGGIASLLLNPHDWLRLYDGAMVTGLGAALVWLVWD